MRWRRVGIGLHPRSRVLYEAAAAGDSHCPACKRPPKIPRMDTQSNGALAGIRIVDLTRILAGPLCAMMLGDMGADIVKVEPPGSGDDTRTWGPPFAGGEAARFLGINRNKRPLTLTPAAPAGQAVLRQLLERADVVIDNFKLGSLAK